MCSFPSLEREISVVQTSDATVGGEKEMTLQTQPIALLQILLVNNAVIFILVAQSVCSLLRHQQKYKSSTPHFLCVGSHHWNPACLVILSSLRPEQRIMKLYETEREILSCRRSRGSGPVTSVILSGQTQHWNFSQREPSVRTGTHCRQKLWDPQSDSVGHYNQNQHYL